MAAWQTWSGGSGGGGGGGGGSAAIDELFVAAGVGSDSNSGEVSTSPLATLGAAVSRINGQRDVTSRILVHVASGVYAWDTPLEGLSIDRDTPVVFIGDGAGQAGDDGFTNLDGAPVADAGSSNQIVVKTGGGMTIDAFQGKTIEILTGAAAGDRRTIRNNTATDIIPASGFTAAVAAGDTYRIVEPAVTIDLPAAVLAPSGPATIAEQPLIARNCGGGVNVYSNQGAKTPWGAAVYLINLRFRAADPIGVAYFGCARTSLAVFGVELTRVGRAGYLMGVVDKASLLSAGIDAILQHPCQIPFQLNLIANDKQWKGWGLADLTDSTGLPMSVANLFGYVVHQEAARIFDARWSILGGAFVATTAAVTVQVAGPAYVVFGGDLTGPDVLLRNALDNQDSAALSAVSGAQVHLDSDVTVECENQGNGLVAFGAGTGQDATPGFISMTSGCTITGITNAGTPNIGVAAAGGGQVNYRGDPVMAGWPVGRQLAVALEFQAMPAKLVASGDLTLLEDDGDQLPLQPTIIPYGPNENDGRSGWIRRL